MRRSITLLTWFCMLLTLPILAQTQRKTDGKRATQMQMANPPQDNTQPVVIRGGKLLTITHGVIDNGTVVMENGKITAVGAANSVRIPANAKVIDATGMTVYPGLIDSETNLGLIEIEADQMTNDLVETSDEIMPHMHVADAFHAESERIPVVRVNGITNVIVAPGSSDTLPGQSSFAQLDGKDRDEMLLVKDVALPMNFGPDQRRRGGGPPGGGGRGGETRYPSTRMGLASQLRQTFLDAQDYAQRLANPQSSSSETSQESSRSSGRGGRGAGGGSKRDLKLEALLPYLQGKKPVVVAARESADIETVMKLAREFNLKVVLNHVTHSQEILDEIASWKVPVIVGPIYDFPRSDERYDAVYSLPAELAKRGVKIAFASYRVEHNRNLPYAAGYSVAF